ncbi:MAG TPA: hypothetical protein GXZ29_05005 [Clostridiales bacterium]|nr:hypothetical protein [Clostridiales bacterium]
MSHDKGFRSLIIIFLCFFLLMNLAACIKAPQESGQFSYNTLIFDKFQQNEEDITKYLVTDEVAEYCDIDLFIDATKSMQGFVRLRTPGLYEEVLQKLEEISLLAFKDHVFSYYRFWDKPEEISRELFRQSAFTADFYESYHAPDDNNPANTNLVNVFNNIASNYGDMSDKELKNQMSVVVTDMVSTSESDRIEMVKTLNESFLRRGMSIALIGIKAQYNGRVYDIVADGASYRFDYEGIRPYYLLLIGSLPNLRSYLEKFNQTFSNLFPDKKESLLIFSHLLTVREDTGRAALNWDESYEDPFINAIAAQHFFSPSLLNDPDIQTTETYRFFHDLVFELPELSTPAGTITFNNPFASDPESVLRLADWELSARVEVIRGREVHPSTGELLDDNQGAQAVITDANNMLSTGDPVLKSNNQRIDVDIMFNMKKMQKDMAYLVRVDLYGKPVVMERNIPDWINQWTMDLTGLAEWQQDPGTFEGHTTPYLNALIGTLWKKAAADSMEYPNLHMGSATIGVLCAEYTDMELRKRCLDAIDERKQK